jgi:hypothetical protein
VSIAALARQQVSRKIALVEVDVADADTGELIDFVAAKLGRWSSHGYKSRPTDDPASLFYPGRMRGNFRVTWSRVAGSLLRGRARAEVGEIELINVDGALRDLASYQVAGQPLRIKLGTTGWTLAEFEEVFGGLCAQANPSRNGRRVILRPVTEDALFDREIQRDLYLGFDGCLSFDGSDYADVGNHFAFGATDSFGIDVRFRRSTSGAVRYLLGKMSAATGVPGLRLNFDAADNLVAHVEDAGGNAATANVAGAAYLDDRWHEASLRVDRATQTLALLVDGAPVASASTAAVGSLVNSQPLLFGALTTGGGGKWDGELDEGRFWSYAPTDAETAANWKSPISPDTPRLIGLYPMNERAGAVAHNEARLTAEGVLLDGVDDSIEVALPAPLYDPAAPVLSIEMMVRDDGSATGFEYLWSEGNSASNNGWVALRNGGALNPTNLQWAVTANSGVTRSVTFTNVLDGGGPKHLLLIDNDGAVRLYVNGILHGESSYTPWGAGNVTLSRAGFAALFRIAPALSWGGNLYYARLWSRALDPDEIPDLVVNRAPKNVSGLEVDLVLDEGGGAPADHSPNARVVTMTGGTWVDTNADITGATWASTLEGPPELQGKPKPTSFGEVPHRHAIQVDQILRVYQVHHRAIEGLDGVYEGGNKLIPLHSVSGATIQFLAGKKRIVGLGGQNMRPLAPGQSVTVSGSASNSGALTVARVDEEEGRWIETVEALVNESPGASVTVATTTDTHDYVPDLATGSFTLVAPATLPVTARLRGDNVGGYVSTVPNIMERIAVDYVGWDPARIGASFAAVAAAHPAVACYATGVEHEQAADCMSRLAVSIGSTWAVDPSGDLEVDVTEPPPALEDVDPADLLDLDPRSLLSLEREDSPQAVSRCLANFRPNFARLTWDQLAEFVQSEPTLRQWAEYITSEGLQVTNDDSSTDEPLNPLSKPQDEIDCYLIDRAATRAVTVRQFALHGVDREVFRARMKLQGYTVNPRTAIVRLVDPRWATTVEGKLCRVIEREGSRTNTVLGVWG